MKIQADSFVKLHFKIRLKDGSIAEDTRNYQKAGCFQMGQGILSDKLEAELLGLVAGENRKIMLLPEDAFGHKHPAKIYAMPKTRFPKDVASEEGLIVSFSQKDGTELPGVITKVDQTEVTVDFNHPLAGQVILFEADILEVSRKEIKT